MKTISFLLFFLIAGAAFSQEKQLQKPTGPTACIGGDSIAKQLYILLTEADALYKQGRREEALERYVRYTERDKGNAKVNDRIRELQNIFESPSCYDGSQQERIRSKAWETYQKGDYAKAQEYYRRMLLLKPGDEEAQLCYDEITLKLAGINGNPDR